MATGLVEWHTLHECGCAQLGAHGMFGMNRSPVMHQMLHSNCIVWRCLTGHLLLLYLQECLHSQLQQLPQLSQLPDNVTGAHFSLPAAGSARAQRAKQAHALALAEAKVGSKWWLPLKALNQQLRDAAAAAEQYASTGSGAASKAAAASGGLSWGSAGSSGLLQQEWQQQEKVWKDSWQRIREEEQQRTSLQDMMEQQEALRPHVVIEQELNSESSWHAAGVV
jgi:hypothetical protein